MQVKRLRFKKLSSFKIAGHQDNAKKSYELSFEERVKHDTKVKKLMRENITSQEKLAFLFQLSTPKLSNRSKELVSTYVEKDDAHAQLVSHYLRDKLNIQLIE